MGVKRNGSIVCWLIKRYRAVVFLNAITFCEIQSIWSLRPCTRKKLNEQKSVRFLLTQKRREKKKIYICAKQSAVVLNYHICASLVISAWELLLLCKYSFFAVSDAIQKGCGFVQSCVALSWTSTGCDANSLRMNNRFQELHCLGCFSEATLALFEWLKCFYRQESMENKSHFYSLLFLKQTTNHVWQTKPGWGHQLRQKQAEEDWDTGEKPTAI